MPRQTYIERLDELDENSIISTELRTEFATFNSTAKRKFFEFISSNYEILTSFSESGVSLDDIITEVFNGRYTKRYDTKFEKLVSEDTLSLITSHDISFEVLCSSYKNARIAAHFEDFLSATTKTLDNNPHADFDYIVEKFCTLQKRIKLANKHGPEELADVAEEEYDILDNGFQDSDSEDVDMTGGYSHYDDFNY